MNERGEPDKREVSKTDKETLVKRVRKLAPLAEQGIDALGSFATHYELEDGVYTSIYIPGPTGQVSEIFDDSIRVVLRTPVGVENGHELVRMKSWIVHLEDFMAEYGEELVVFDRDTGKPLRTNMTDNTQQMIEAYNLKIEFGPSPDFTPERLRELHELLDSLQPDKKFYQN